jgi:hypothetical protein
MSKHYVGEVGTDFLLDTGINIGTVTAQAIYYKNPGGTSGTWSATLYDSYSELAVATGTYYLRHTLVAADLSTSGEWIFQAFVASIAGSWWGEAVKLNIYGLYE